MNNILDFVIKIQDLASGKVLGLASTVQRATGQIGRNVAGLDLQVRGVATTASRMGVPFVQSSTAATAAMGRVRAATAAATSEVNNLRGAVERMGAQSKGMGLPGLLSGAAVMAGAGAGALAIVRAAGQAQQDLIGLSTFLGKEAAGRVYEQIQQDAAATPFGTKGLLSANRALISAGLNADRARADVLALANAIAATGGGDDELGRMAQNMQQIKNAGVATAADIKQFGFAGINIYQLLANATGKTAKEAQDMTVSYDLLSRSLQAAAGAGGMYAGAMAAQSQSIMGKWSTLMDGIEMAMARIGMSQSEAITGLIDRLIGITDRLPALAEQWSGAIGKIVEGMVQLTGVLINGVKWLYHNWYWIKYVAGALGIMYTAAKVATVTMTVYNGLMLLSAARTVGLGVAMTGAATAATGLNLALLATPWGIIAMGAAGLGLALMALNSQTKELDANTKAALATMERYEGINIATKQAKGWQNVNTVPTPGIVNAVSDGISVGKYPWKRNDNQAPFMMGGAAAGASSAAAADAGTRITGGGSRSIVINVGKFQDQTVINAATVSEGVAEIENKMGEMFLRLLQTANAAR